MSSRLSRLFTALRSPRKFALIAFLAITAVSVVAYATTLSILDSDASTTGVSGTSGELPQYVGHNGPYQGVYGISIGEVTNVPCDARVMTRHINNGNQQVRSLDRSCDPNQGAFRTVEFTNQNRYVRGVQVCQQQSNGRIKGLRILGGDIDPNTGELTIVNNTQEFSRPNCNDNWRPARTCPVGKIASRVIFHSNATGVWSYFSLTGVQLECRSVVPNTDHSTSASANDTSTTTPQLQPQINSEIQVDTNLESPTEPNRPRR